MWHLQSRSFSLSEGSQQSPFKKLRILSYAKKPGGSTKVFWRFVYVKHVNQQTWTHTMKNIQANVLAGSSEEYMFYVAMRFLFLH